MGVKKSDDQFIAALETTMSGLSFNTDNNGWVRIEENNAELPGAQEQTSLLELTPPPTPTRRDVATKGTANFLPMEIVSLILGFIDPSGQREFASTSKVCRQWYFASQQFLYRFPKITGKNYIKFVSTISPTSTNIKASPLSSLIKKLDLSMIVHEGKPSLNARLLHRVQSSLEYFVAPQSSFGYNCIVALGHCKRLRLLDLSLTSQSVNLDDLFRHISDLPNLIVLNFPRSSILSSRNTRFRWPRRLERFSLGGAVLQTNLLLESELPVTLRELYLSHCPFTRIHSVISLLSSLSTQLTTLSVSYPMPCLPFNALDSVLSLCPNLTYLLVSVDYISKHFFDDDNIAIGHPLHQLDLESSGNLGVERKISPNDVFIAAAGSLSALRIVRVSNRLGWMKRPDTVTTPSAKQKAKRMKQDVEDLVDMLEAKAEESGEAPNKLVGVWEYDSDGKESRRWMLA